MVNLPAAGCLFLNFSGPPHPSICTCWGLKARSPLGNTPNAWASALHEVRAPATPLRGSNPDISTHPMLFALWLEPVNSATQSLRIRISRLCFSSGKLGPTTLKHGERGRPGGAQAGGERGMGNCRHAGLSLGLSEEQVRRKTYTLPLTWHLTAGSQEDFLSCKYTPDRCCARRKWEEGSELYIGHRWIGDLCRACGEQTPGVWMSSFRKGRRAWQQQCHLSHGAANLAAAASGGQVVSKPTASSLLSGG